MAGKDALMGRRCGERGRPARVPAPRQSSGGRRTTHPTNYEFLCVLCVLCGKAVRRMGGIPAHHLRGERAAPGAGEGAVGAPSPPSSSAPGGAPSPRPPSCAPASPAASAAPPPKTSSSKEASRDTRWPAGSAESPSAAPGRTGGCKPAPSARATHPAAPWRSSRAARD
jgi:hypothetical protein